MITTEVKITTFQQIKNIIEPIDKDLFQVNFYGHCKGLNDCKNNGPVDNGCSCFLGHIHRHFNPLDASAGGDGFGYGARQLTQLFLKEKHGEYFTDGTTVNNCDNVNGYNQPEIKDRLMAMINDGIEWENSKR